MEHPHREQKGCVCSCMPNGSQCRSSAYIQAINAATNVEIFLRNGCHVLIGNTEGHFPRNLPFHCVDTVT